MPPFLPDRLEAGTLNVTGIAGLLEGVRYIKRRSLGRIYAHEVGLLQHLSEAISECPGVTRFVSERAGTQTGVLSVVIEGKDCSDAAAYLGDRGVCVRSGLHCAPEAHRTAGTVDSGTVRLSVSPFTTPSEVTAAAALLGKFART
jgi:selenocysteine lyase/cysteine desulfurase